MRMRVLLSGRAGFPELEPVGGVSSGCMAIDGHVFEYSLVKPTTFHS